MRKTILLLIIDGLGIGRNDHSNPIYTKQPKTLNFIRQNFLGCSLQASGIAIGLPWEEPGSSQIGHLSIGIGRAYYHNYPRISMTIRDNTFYNNDVLKTAFKKSLEQKNRVHFIGLLSKSNQFASLEHLEAMLKMAAQNQIKEVFLHLISDGKDSPPKSFLELFGQIQKTAGAPKMILSTISGRYYAMDPDLNWKKTELFYKTLTNKNEYEVQLDYVLKKYYEKNLDDRFIEPYPLIKNGEIKDDDIVIFSNFEESSLRQIVLSFAQKDFAEFPTKKFNNLTIVTLADYGSNINAQAIFPKEKINTCLSKVISENHKTQIKIGETIKEREMTYFFNGFAEEPFENEYRSFSQSLELGKIEKFPQMKIDEITARTLEALNENAFDLIVASIPNLDVLTHQRNYEAILKGIEAVDATIEKILDAVVKTNSTMIITSDHGFSEKFYDPMNWLPQKYHTKNPVPFYLIGQQFKKQKTIEEAGAIESQPIGILTDIAPTILSLMNLPIPKEFDGKNLLPYLA